MQCAENMEESTVGNVAQMWNPRSSQRLRRHWVSFEDQIIIGGEGLEQAGVLSVRHVGEGELCARLRVMGREFEESVVAGNDIAVWINGLELFIGVKAVDEERMLVAFGIPPGSKVNVTLDAGAGVEDDAKAYTRGNDSADSGGFAGPIGLRQTRP
jgi:Fe2+ transport system protein FeoA